jgi:hypothetical protein
MTRPWPWPGESAVKRRERVAQSYRAVLELVAPDRCAELDAQMLVYGQSWVVPRVLIYGPDDLLTAILTADYAGVTLKTVYVWRERGLRSVTTPDGIRFRFSDLQKWVGGDRSG